MIDAIGRPQSVLVLGGSSEIAQAIVAGLVPARCKTVLLAGRPSDRLEAAADAARAAGAETVETVPYDTSDPAGAAAAVTGAFEAHGDIDIVIGAAGILGEQAALDVDPEATAVIITTNFTGLAASLVAAADRMRHQGHGRIVVISSVAGDRARKANFTYGSTKAGLDAFAQGLGDSLVGTGVGVTIVRPGFVKGRMTEGMDPAPFSTTPDAVAADTIKGIASGTDVVYSPGILRWVFAVMKLLPRAIWRRMPG